MTAFEPYSKVVCPNCGQSVRVRRKFDHFIITRQLGEGGMSRVFESADEVLSRPVALKILNRHYSRDGARMKQFEREAQLTGAVTHGNVVRLYSTGRDQGNFYIAMELMGGGSLEERIRNQGKLGEVEALRVGREVAEGLRAAYREGLIHRDVKPANILFTEEGTPKIVDFGLALFHERDVDDSGEIWATPFYVAPEKVINDSEDFRSDMFSLGATLFHAMTGKPPHKANTNSLSELKVIKSRAVKMEDSKVPFSARTCEIINRLLALKPEDRFASYDELVEAFRDAESLFGIAEISRRARRRKLILAAIGAGAVGIAVLAALPHGGGKEGPDVDGDSTVSAEELTTVGKSLASGSRPVTEIFLDARNTLLDGKITDAQAMFDELAKSSRTKQPTRNWARFNAALCAIITGKRDLAMRDFREIHRSAAEAEDVGGAELALFFKRFGTRMAAKNFGLDVAASDASYSTSNEQALAYLVHGLAHWQFGDPSLAAPWLEAFGKAEPAKGFEWINSYKKLAASYLDDAKVLVALGPFAQQPALAIEEAKEDSEKCRKALTVMKTSGAARGQIEARMKFDLSEMSRIKQDVQQRAVTHQKEVREREQAQYAEIVTSLPALARGYDFSRVVDLLKDTRFETPEVQTAVSNKLYLWSKSQEFMEQVLADVNLKGYTGTVSRRIGAPIQGRLAKMDLTSLNVALPRGAITVPTETLTPDALIAIAQQFSAAERDSAEYYRRQEMIAVFAKVAGLEQMAHAVSAQLMEENRLFRQRWTLVEQSGS